jgi:hypothetical protein
MEEPKKKAVRSEKVKGSDQKVKSKSEKVAEDDVEDGVGLPEVDFKKFLGCGG